MCVSSFRFRFSLPPGPVLQQKNLSPVGERLYFQSTMHATFLPLSPKDDEQQGNDVNIRMIQGVHSRFSVFVCFQRQCIRVQGKSACYAGCFLSDYGKDMDIKSVEQIIS